ncbi:hypothetical protein WA158_002159 [Blastocystis sp. Blastoise]
MGKPDKGKEKQETKPSTTVNQNSKETQAKKAKGHKQTGAGAVVSSKGPRVQAGIVIQEWQRTPLQIIQQYCQKNKRPKPIYCKDQAAHGKYKFKLILPDMKNHDKDLVYKVEESYDDETEAKHYVCLLAMYTLEPKTPYERLLPEPYKTTWINMTSSNSKGSSINNDKETKNDKKPSLLCSFCNKSFDKQFALDMHIKKEHPTTPTSPVTPITPITPVTPVTPITPTPNTIKSSITPTISDSKNINSKITQSITSKVSPVSPVSPLSPPVSKTVTLKNTYITKYDQKQHYLQKDIKQRQYENKKSVRKLLDDTIDVYLSEENQECIEHILQSETSTIPYELNDKWNSSSGIEIQTRLRKDGFTDLHIQQCQKYCPPILSNCYDWLCVYLPDKELPPAFSSLNKQLSMADLHTRSPKHLLTSYGFSKIDVSQVLKDTNNDLYESITLLYKSLIYAATKHDLPLANESTAAVYEELETLASIYGYEGDLSDWNNIPECPSNENLTDDNCVPMTVFKHPNHLLEINININYDDNNIIKFIFFVHPSYSYPANPPLCFVQTPLLSASFQLFFTYLLYTYWTNNKNAPILYDLVLYIQENISSYIHPKDLIPPINIYNIYSRYLKFIHGEIEEEQKPNKQGKYSNQRNGKRNNYGNSTQSEQSSIDDPFTSNIIKDIIVSVEHLPTPPVSLQSTRQSLPVYKQRDTFLDILHKNQYVLISGETGSGKSTQIPQYILEDASSSGMLDRTRVICTQPRRIAAMGLGLRVSEEIGDSCGGICGYSVRGEKWYTILYLFTYSTYVSKNTHLIYCTIGVLLRYINSDPLINRYTHIVIDEVHERSVESDFLLAILKQVLVKNKHIKIIIMSATFNEKMFSSYFFNCPALYIPGRMYPVQQFYLDDILMKTKYIPPNKLDEDIDLMEDERNRGIQKKSDILFNWSCKYIDYAMVTSTIAYIIQYEKSINKSILVFLPGVAEIRTVKEDLTSYIQSDSALSSKNIQVLMCHGGCTNDEQKQLFTEIPNKTYRVVLATNIAETSITIPQCVYVIDIGIEKQMRYNVYTKISELKNHWISQASANQRKGRAGRVCDGYIYRLYPQSMFDSMEKYNIPEIQRISIDSVLMQVLYLGYKDIFTFMSTFIEPPQEDAIRETLDMLETIKAVQRDGSHYSLTPLGLNLSTLPLQPRLAKILVFGCIFSCIEPMLTIASYLSIRSPFRIPIEHFEDAKIQKQKYAHRFSDHMTFVNIYNAYIQSTNKRQFCRDLFLSRESMNMIVSLRQDYITALQSINFLPRDYKSENNTFNAYSHEDGVIKGVLSAGLYPNIVLLKKPKPKFQSSSSGVVEKNARVQELKYLIKTTKDIPTDSSDEDNGLTPLSKMTTRVYIHPSSSNFSETVYPYPFLVYHNLVNTSKLYLHDISSINTYTLLLFGGNVDVQYDKQTIMIDGWIRLHSPPRVSVLIKRLLEQLDIKLLDKYKNPQNNVYMFHYIVEAIVKLLTTNGI